MSFTVARLHKELGKLIEQGHGRKPVKIIDPALINLNF